MSQVSALLGLASRCHQKDNKSNEGDSLPCLKEEWAGQVGGGRWRLISDPFPTSTMPRKHYHQNPTVHSSSTRNSPPLPRMSGIIDLTGAGQEDPQWSMPGSSSSSSSSARSPRRRPQSSSSSTGGSRSSAIVCIDIDDSDWDSKLCHVEEVISLNVKKRADEYDVDTGSEDNCSPSRRERAVEGRPNNKNDSRGKVYYDVDDSDDDDDSQGSQDEDDAALTQRIQALEEEGGALDEAFSRRLQEEEEEGEAAALQADHPTTSSSSSSSFTLKRPPP